MSFMLLLLTICHCLNLIDFNSNTFNAQLIFCWPCFCMSFRSDCPLNEVIKLKYIFSVLFTLHSATTFASHAAPASSSRPTLEADSSTRELFKIEYGRVRNTLLSLAKTHELSESEVVQLEATFKKLTNENPTLGDVIRARGELHPEDVEELEILRTTGLGEWMWKKMNFDRLIWWCFYDMHRPKDHIQRGCDPWSQNILDKMNQQAPTQTASRKNDLAD